jgi:uracil-DNA glycosylase
MPMTALSTLLHEIRACRLCTEQPLSLPLPHAPRPVLQVDRRARILIAGQAPGARVHATSIPFNDPSGDRLRHWLAVDRRTFYDPAKFAVVPMGLCFPGYDASGADLPPRRECAPHWRERILALLPALELIVCVGRYAQTWHMQGYCGATVAETVDNWRAAFKTLAPRVLPTPHPSWRNTAWLKRNPRFEAEVIPALRAEVARLTA